MESSIYKKESFSLSKLKESSLRTKLILIGVGCAAIIFIWYLMDSRFQTRKLQGVMRTQQQLTQNLNRKNQDVIKLKRLALETLMLRTQFQNLVKQLPPKSKMDRLLKDITKIGRDEELKFVSFKPQPEKTFGFYAAIPINISMLGDYHHLAEFLSTLANLEQLVIVQDFTLSRENKAQDILTMRLVLNVYHSMARGSL